MLCPECGKENPDNNRACGYCSCALTNPDIEQQKTNTKLNVMIVGSALLAGLAGSLSFFAKPVLAFFVAILSFCSAIAAIVKILKSRKRLKEKIVAVTILISVFTFILLLSYLRIDAAPIFHDYTISDLRSAPPECDQTYELLGQLTDVSLTVHSMSPIGLSAHEIRRLEEINDLCKEKEIAAVTLILQDSAGDLMDMWQHAEKGRQVISKLNEFPEIADLGEPNLKIEKSWFVSLRHLAFLHHDYICLQSIQGNHKTAMDELLIYESFVRKLSLNARSIITNLVCIACSAITIDTANFIINNPDTPDESLLLLRQHMIPLSPERTSLRNALISEYLVWKKEFLKMSDYIRMKYKYSTIYPLKLNSSLRLSRNFVDELIAAEERVAQAKEYKVWPALYPNLPVEIGHDGKLPLYYKMYNPIGAKLICIFAPAIDKVLLIRTKLHIRSDLLKIVLDKRLGIEVNLKARAFSDKYIVDIENRKILSPGPDGKPGTKDDIKLLIDPDVLNINPREN